MLSVLVKTLICADSSVFNYPNLIKGLDSSIEILVTDKIQNGIAKITEALYKYSSICNVHIISHGSPGCLYLGNIALNLETIEQYSLDLRSWFSRDSKFPVVHPQILLYGCNVAAGDAGDEFLSKLHRLTQASISASTTFVGQAALGSNWQLNYQLGQANAENPIAQDVLHAYQGVLGAPNITDTLTTIRSTSKEAAPIISELLIADSDTSTQSVALAVTNGTLLLASTTGLTVTENNPSSIALSGAIATSTRTSYTSISRGSFMNAFAPRFNDIAILADLLQSNYFFTPLLVSTLIVIDAGVEDYQTLVDGVVEGAAVVVLERDRDGVKQISEMLSQHPAIASLYVVSHGSPGCLYLGNSELSLSTLKVYAEELQGWFSGISKPRLLLYGCNVAAGDAGEDFVEKLQTTTGASIAASSSLVGNAAKGGSWQLDFKVHPFSVAVPFNHHSLDAYSGVLEFNSSTSLFNLANSSADYADVVGSFQDLIGEELFNFFSQDDFLTQLSIPFGAMSGSSGAWTNKALALQESILNCSYSIRLEVRSGSELEGALGAYSAVGTTGQATIYLNANWLNTASSEQIQAVLLEELGHSFDDQLNSGVDSAGDEGQIFSALVRNISLDSTQLSLLRTEDDTNTITLDGQKIVVEQAIDFVPSSSLWTNLSKTNDPNKGTTDGSWTANASDFAGNATNPYLQIQTDGTNIAFKVLAESQSGDFKALMGIFIDVDGDGSPDFTVQLNVANITGGYKVAEYTFIPIAQGIAADANTRPNNTVIPATNSGTYFDLKVGNLDKPSNLKIYGSAARTGADGTVERDIDADGSKENYYVFSFTLAQLAAFRTLVANTYNGGVPSSVYKEIPQWPTEQNKVYAVGLTASNSLNAVNGDIGGGAYTSSDTWKDIFGFQPPLPPIGANDTATVLEDIATPIIGNLLANDTDSNNDPLKITQFVVSGTTYTFNTATASHTVSLSSGTLIINSDGNYSFQPASNYTGPVPGITYTVSDGALTSTAILSIGITPVNDAPSGANKTITTNEDSAYTFSASDFGFTDSNDSPANTLQSVAITTLPATGTLKLNGNTFVAGTEITVDQIPLLTYTPAANDNGSNYANITFQVRDNGGVANGGINLDPTPNTIVFNINAVNDAPIAAADIATAVEAGGLSNATAGTNPVGNVLTNDTDVDAGDTKTVTSVINTAATSILATPAIGSTSGSSPAIASGQYGTLAIGADGSYVYTVDNSNITVQALRLSSNTLTETFTYTIKDSDGATSTSALTVTIQGSNDTPTATLDYNIVTGTSASVAVQTATGNVLTNDTDVDANGETKAIKGTTASANGSSAGTNTITQITLASIAGVALNDYVRYNAGGANLLDAANLPVQVTAISGSTITLSGGGTVSTLSTSPPTSLLFTTTANGNGSPDTQTLSSFVSTVSASNTINVGSINGTIAVGMVVTGTDSGGNTFTRQVTAVNNTNGTITVDGAALVVSSTATTLSFTNTLSGTATITGQYGTLQLNTATGGYSYTPNSGLAIGAYNDVLNYTMQDASGATSSSTLTIHVEVQATPPDAKADTATALEAGGVSNGAVGSNPSGNVITGVGTGSVADTGTGIAISNAWSSTTAIETSVATGTIITGQYGTLTISSDGAYSYALNNSNTTVEALRTSTDTLAETFFYRLTNSGGSDVTTLTITIQGANDAPVATADTATATEAGGTANTVLGFNPSGSVLSNDTDKDSGDTKTVSKIIAGAGAPTTTVAANTSVSGTYGTLVMNPDGSYSYTVNNGNSAVNALAAGQTVTEAFTYEVKDTAGGTYTTTLTLTVNGANDAPVNTVLASLTFAEDTSAAISFSVTDPENDAGQTLTSELASVQLAVTNGSLTIGNLNGAMVSSGVSGSTTLTLSGTQEQINLALTTLSYQGNPYFSGADTLTITSTDGLGLQDIDTIPITVNPDNRPLTVNNLAVNEGSSYAVFTVDGEIGQKVSLTLTSGTATSGSDFSPNLEYWNGSAWISYTGNPVTIPNLILDGTTANTSGLLFVRTAILNDQSSEGSETFTLTANNKAGTPTNGTATIKDDGSGTTFNNGVDDNTSDGAVTKDDDRPLTVSSVIVNEASPYAVFEVVGVVNQWVKLGLTDGSATSTTDYGSTLEYGDGSDWNFYTSGSFIQIPIGNKVFVRTAIINDFPGVYEGTENFGLTATNTGGTSSQGIGAIVDDGTGTKYTGTISSGNPDTNTSNLDNDLSVSVAVDATPVNEGSPYAMFTVVGTARQNLFLTLGNTASTVDQDATIGSFAMEYSYDRTNWFTYSTGDTNYSVPVVPGSGTVYVRVNISSEADLRYEGEETFTLTAALGANNATDTATIIDNGTGTIFNNDGTPNLVATKDDDRPIITLATSPTSVVEDGITNLVYTFTRSGDTTQSLTINYGISGTADSADYTGATPGSGKTMTFAAGSSTATLTIDPASDVAVESDETVILSLASGSGYTIGVQNTATGTITNDDPANTPPRVDLDQSDTGTLNNSATFAEVVGADTGANAVNFTKGAINLSDSEDLSLTSLKVSIDKTTLQAGDQLLLGATSIDIGGNTATGTVAYGGTTFTYSITDSGNTRTLTFSKDGGGSAPLTDYETLIDALKYNSTSDTPGGSRVFSVITNDGSLDSTPATFTVNITGAYEPPAIALSDTALIVGETSLVTFTFNEIPTGFDASDITSENGAISGLTATVDPKIYTATFTPTVSIEDLTNLITVGTGYTNPAGNTGTAATSANYTIDTLAPTVAISLSDAALITGETCTVTFTFSEVPTGFTTADITAENGAISGLTATVDPKIYTAIFTPTINIEDLTNLITVGTGYNDSAGNIGTTATSANYTIDTLAPIATILVADTALKIGEASAVTITFSEAVTGFTIADLTVANGTVSGLSSADGGVTWAATFTPIANLEDTTNVISLDKTGVTDLAGNSGIGSTDSNNYAIDTLAPTIAITSDKPALKAGETAILTFTLSEPSTDFVEGDIAVSGGTLSNLAGSGTSYTATFTPTADSSSNGVITVASIKFSDAAGNQNADGADADNTATLAVDTLKPTIAITSDKPALKAGETAALTFTLSEPSNDFVAANIAVLGGTLSGFAGSGTTYTATFTPNTNSTTSAVITVASNTFSDAAGNLNADGADANNTATLTIDTIIPTIAISPISTDDIINALEDDFPVAIAGTTTGVEDGRTVTVTLNGTTYTTTATNNTWTLNVPAADAQALSVSETVTANVSDLAGNPAVQATRNITHDGAVPSVTVNTLVTNDGTPQLTGAIDDPTAIVKVSVNNQTYTAINNGNGTWTLADNTITTALAFGVYDVTAIATNTLGNIGTDTTARELFIDQDSDDDGVLNSNDLDDDNDGILDTIEQNGNPNRDTDGDGVIDRLDLDSDNDGILDVKEAGHKGFDSNGDGRVDGSYGKNGLADSVETSPESGTLNYTPLNTDGDSVPDFQDLDSDNDGISDVIEAGGKDPDGDGIIGQGKPIDINGNGLADSVDSQLGGMPLPIPDQDGDGQPNFRDLDSDNDGIFDLVEQGLNALDTNNDGKIDGADRDRDGLIDTLDGNSGIFGSGSVPLPAPLDQDGNGISDFLEPPAAATGSQGADDVVGTNGDDILNGFSDIDILRGLGGNDLINGGSSRDTIYGDEGNDILNGGSDDDYMNGGIGNDRLSGGTGNDSMFGGDGDDILDGGDGNDLVRGNRGRDIINGGDGKDRLYGDQDNDIIHGNRGNDLLVGGFGKDTLTGGQGSDRFAYKSVKEFGDIITDFEILKDRIDVKPIRGLNSIGDLRFVQRGRDTVISAHVGNGFQSLTVLQDVRANTLTPGNFIF